MRRYFLPNILLFLIFITSALAVFGQNKPVSPEITVTKCWAYPTIELGMAIASDGTRIYTGGDGAKIESLSLDGKKIWSTELGGDLSSNLFPTEKGLVLATSTERATGEKAASVLRSLSKETGITNWTVKLPEAERYVLGPYSGSAIVVSKSGTIQAMDAADGSVKWKREIAEGFVAEPVFSPTKVIVAGKANQIFSVSLATGEIESMRRSVFPVTSLGELPSGEIVAGDERGNVSTLNGTDKPLWRFKSGGEISRIFISGENILATSHDNFIYLLMARNGDVDWKKRLGGRVLQLANVGDKYVLTMSFEENVAIFTDLVTGKVAGQIVFAEGEKLVAQPVVSNAAIYMHTDRAVYSYSLGTCGERDLLTKKR
ncbi:MAG: PQQ-binding-like beta-propeller repeat protein [Pyrinomonadaceae bacterium]